MSLLEDPIYSILHCLYEINYNTRIILVTLRFGSVSRWIIRASQVLNGKEFTYQCKRCGFHPGSGRSPRGGNGNPLQYSCLENSMDRGAWQAAVHGVAKSQTCLKRLRKAQQFSSVIDPNKQNLSLRERKILLCYWKYFLLPK